MFSYVKPAHEYDLVIVIIVIIVIIVGIAVAGKNIITSGILLNYVMVGDYANFF
jgi:uncharacterized protein (UPF0333 family)